MLPDLFTQRLQSFYSANIVADILRGLQPKTHFAVRINRLKTTRTAFLAILEEKQIPYTLVDWYEDAVIFPLAHREILLQMPSYQQGHFYLQNLSSMLPALVLQPQPGEEILDLTAAPGSKTCQLAALMNNQGRIAAVEIVKNRFFKLKANLEQQGVTCAATYLKDGSQVWRHCQNRFDRVLLDAPCSSEGRFNAEEIKSYQYWSLEKINAMTRKQWPLFMSAFLCLKPKGTLVYSTCTFAPEENEMIITKLLKKFPGQVEIQSVHFAIENAYSGLTQWQEKTWAASLVHSQRILPDHVYEGFFVCRLVKR